MESEITIEWIIVNGLGIGFVLYAVPSIIGYSILKAIELFHITSKV